MGWWGTGILSGDMPLDRIWVFEKYAGIDRESEDGGIFHPSRISEALATRLKALIEKDDMAWLNVTDENEYEHPVTVQVGAVIALAVGAKLSVDYKDKAIEIIQQDEWAKEDEERRVSINLLCHELMMSDGRKHIISSRGLMEMMVTDRSDAAGK